MDPITLSESQILEVANQLMDELMQASTERDYDAHVRNFTERARSALPREAFARICSDYQEAKGFFGKREFVAMFHRPHSVAVVWKQLFTKAPGEHVAELVLVRRGNRHLVDHVMVF